MPPVLDRAADDNLIVQGLFDFVAAEVAPREEELAPILEDPRTYYDETGRVHAQVQLAWRAIRRASAKAGYYTMFVPEDIGGGGLGHVTLFRAWQRLYERFGPGDSLAYNAISHWATGPSAVWRYVTDEMAREVRPRVMAGELIGSFGMSEPDAGSDAWALKTRAVPDGDRWLLTGSKQWTSWAPYADYCMVLAVTDPDLAAKRRSGVSCFYVPASSPGFTVDSVIRLFGEIGGNEAILGLNEVAAGPSQLVGELHRGFDLGMLNVTTGRIYNSARCTGAAQWALRKGIEYAKVRHTFGSAIADHQSVQILLADCAVDIFTAEAAGLELARRMDAGQQVRSEAAISKLHATNAAWRVFDRIIQVYGGMGITNETGLYAGMQMTRALRIADGTDEILRRTIAKEMLAHGPV
jgi:acyl-CoA dehydrogenase